MKTVQYKCNICDKSQESSIIGVKVEFGRIYETEKIKAETHICHWCLIELARIANTIEE